MAIAFVQRVAIVSSAAGQTTTGAQGGTFTAGNLLCAIVGWSTSVAAPTDISIPSGWTAPLAMKANGAPNGAARAYYMANNAGGSQTWTWNLTVGSATAQSWGIEILEFSGVATSSLHDRHRITRRHTSTRARHGIRRHRIRQPRPSGSGPRSLSLRAMVAAIAAKLGVRF